MSARGLQAFRAVAGWIAAVLFVLFCGNIVAAKLAMLAGLSIPLLGVVTEFFLLHAAIICFIAYALARESIEGVPRRDTETVSAGEKHDR